MLCASRHARTATRAKGPQSQGARSFDSVKPREALGLEGRGDVEVMSAKVPDRGLADMLLQQPGCLRGYPAANWRWVSAVLDGTVPVEDLFIWPDDSHCATARGASL